MYGHLFWVVYRPNLMLAPCLCACVCATPIRVFYSQGWTPVICVAVDFDLKNGPSTKKITHSKATLADDSRAMMARGDGSGLAWRLCGVCMCMLGGGEVEWGQEDPMRAGRVFERPGFEKKGIFLN